MKKLDKIMYIYIFGIVVLLLLIVGTTFAFFTAIAESGPGKITGSTATMGLNLSVFPKSDGINNPLVPQETSSIADAVIGTENGSCVDDNNNTVCQVYEIVIENTGDTSISLNGTISFVAPTVEDLKWGLGTSATSGFSSSNTYAKTETDLIGPGVNDLQSISLEASDNVSGSGDDTAKFYIVVYIEERSINQSSTNYGDFTGTVTFNAASGNGVSATFVS